MSNNTTKDISSLYIRYNGHPRYTEGAIITDNYVDSIFNRMEMILFTNKGEVISDLDFGANVTDYLWNTFTSADFLKEQIYNQFDKYLLDINRNNYVLDVFIYEGSFRDICVIKITVNDNELLAYYS